LTVAAALSACSSDNSKLPQSAHSTTGSPVPSASSSAVSGTALGLQSAYTETVRKTLPSVVEITTSSGLGSGVILDTHGNIVTNAHVVGQATTFQVGLAGTAKTYPAKLVGTFPPDDLAVIRITGAPALQPATFGNSSALRTGDIVMAIGNPLGLSSSVTEGIVSALGRTVDEPQDADSPGATIPDAIQTSAAINPGNSGGALVSLSGDVVGIPTLAAVDPQIGGGSAAPGIGFAIASNVARNIASQLVSDGKVTNSGRAALGISVSTVTDPNGNPVGVGIVSVAPGGPAAKAGLVPGETITKLDMTRIASTQDLADALAEHVPGQRVTLTVTPANGGSREVNVLLGTLGR
jgi:S1-C subfamily serine protease